MEKKLNNLLSFEDFEKSWKSEEQKKTKRTDVGMDIIKEDSDNAIIPASMKRAKAEHDEMYGTPPETARWKNTMYFPSGSSDRKYTVGYDLTRGEWTCNCPGWLIARNGDKNRTCKHLKSIASEIGGEQGRRLKLGGR